MQLTYHDENITLEIQKLDETTIQILELYIASLKLKQIHRTDASEQVPEKTEPQKTQPALETEKKPQEAVLQSLLSDRPVRGRPKKNPVESQKRSHKKTHTEFIEISEKHCPRCDTTKPILEFNKSKADRTGRQPNCRDCQREINNEYNQKRKPVKSEKQPDNLPKEDTTQTPPVKAEQKKTLGFTPERDQKLRDAFKKDLGVSGIYDADILPGFNITEIRRRCQELGLLDQYGLRPSHKGKPGLDTSEF